MTKNKKQIESEISTLQSRAETERGNFRDKNDDNAYINALRLKYYKLLAQIEELGSQLLAIETDLETQLGALQLQNSTHFVATEAILEAELAGFNLDPCSQV
ncbi:MAG: hypothetical protein K0T99_02405 [Alphaproteobacteria bacterium]|nr:hypothetical protein [Alphaproteobacteria bacterium]